jgi:hypothetical protein
LHCIARTGTQFGLPFLPPSKSSSADFKQGANMAITGATAMDAPFFRSLGLSDKIWNNGPISFQLQWFQQIATAVCGQSIYIYYMIILSCYLLLLYIYIYYYINHNSIDQCNSMGRL